MIKDSLMFDLVLTALSTLPPAEFTEFLTAYCSYYGLPQPVRVDVESNSGEQMSGSPRDLWQRCNPNERLMLIMPSTMRYAR